MFSPSALGGSICLRCQIRAVSRRAPPLLAAAQVRGRRRQYASNATNPRPEDVTPVPEIKDNHRETEQRLGGPRQPRPDETSPSVAAEQPLPDPPRDAPTHALDLPDGGMIDNYVPRAFEESQQRAQGPQADVYLGNERTSEPDYRAKDGNDVWKTNQEEGMSVGQPHEEGSPKKARVLGDRTCPHCQKAFRKKALLDDHIKQGCASLKPPRNLKCPQCQETFGTKKLLHRHFTKSSCSAKGDPGRLAGNEDGQKMEDILSQAAAEFSKSKASGRLKSTIADDWSLPQHQELRTQAAAAERELDRSAGEYLTGDVEVTTQTEAETNNEKDHTGVTEAAIPEHASRSRDEGNEKRGREDLDGPLIRKIGKVVRITRGRPKEHRRGDMVLVEDASKLDVDSLGKAAEVIVLRDGRQWGRRAFPVEASSEAIDSGLKIEDFLDEQEVLSLDDVVNNIHGLKPERQIIPAREFKSLFNTLLDGFTILQLEKYVVWHREKSILERIKDDVFGKDQTPKEEPTTTEEALLKGRQYTWMTEQAHWLPYVDGAVEEAQYPLAGYITRNMSPKQRLVVQLMRECWDVSIQELLNGNGRVDIRVRDLEFKLLTREYSTVYTSPLLLN